jgi:hypothetical protein
MYACVYVSIYTQTYIYRYKFTHQHVYSHPNQVPMTTKLGDASECGDAEAVRKLIAVRMCMYVFMYVCMYRGCQEAHSGSYVYVCVYVCMCRRLSGSS